MSQKTESVPDCSDGVNAETGESISQEEKMDISCSATEGDSASSRPGEVSHSIFC